MKYTSFALAFILFIVFQPVIHSQPTNNYVTGATIPAPNAGSLGKYADIPVSYFTGVPDISIPIYTVEEGPLKLPVSLSYHAGGIKVAETASWVGLGWSLNAGGMITRSVQGLPDETYELGYYTFGSQIPAQPAGATQEFTDFLVNNVIFTPHDMEMDLFSFNVGGYSGKFYIDHKDAPSQGKPAYRFVPQQDLKLEFLPDFSRFTIIAPDGTRYTFGKVTIAGNTIDARETSHQFGQPGGSAYYSSWYLVLVESADRKYSVNLSYTDEYLEYKNLSAGKWVYEMSGCAGGQGSYQLGYQGAGGALDPYHYATTMEMSGKRLTGINFSSGSVTFSATVNRQDLDGGTAKRLESIQISSGSPEVVCKKFDFSYDYYQDPANTTLPYYKRLRLTQVQEKSCDGTIVVPPHVFNYQGTFLPNRMSKATDHWGYYNGATANETQLMAVPTTTIWNSYTMTNVTYGSANKESNGTEMLKGMITDITYPTGGKTFFTFEPNVVQAGTPSVLTKVDLVNCNSSPTTCCGLKTGTSSTITLSGSELPAAKFNITASQNSSCVATNIPVVVKAYLDAATDVLVGTYSFNFSTPNSSPVTTADVPLSTLGSFTAGSPYYFTVQATDGYARLKVIVNTTVWQNTTVGGLRIKQIRASETASATPVAGDIIKDYEYLVEGSTTSTSGVMYKKPTYGFDIISMTLVGVPGLSLVPENFHQLFFTESTIEPLFNLEGYHFGYARVKEKWKDNGSKVVKMYSLPNTYNYGKPYPYPPAQPSVSLGKTQFESVYNESGTLLTQTQTTGGEFFVTPPENAGNMLKIVTNNHSCTYNDLGTTFSLSAYNFLITPYKNYTNAFKVTSEVKTIDGVSTTTNYSYDALGRFLAPTATEFTNSDGKATKTEMTYVHDLPASCVRDSLLRKNIISQPWKTVNKVNNVQVSGSQTDFAAFDVSTGAFVSTSSCGSTTFPRPYQIKNYEVTWDATGTITLGKWVLKGTFNSYSPQGLPAFFTMANWADPETYTWRSDGALLSKTFKSHVTTYDYYPSTDLIRSITDIDGRKTAFTYDKLMRLTKATKDNAGVNGSGVVVDGNVKTEYTYHYKDGTDPYNWVKTKNSFTPVTGSSLTSTETIEYLDGLGRTSQTVKKAWSPTSKDVVTAVAYDNQGRISKQYIPFMTTVGTGAFASIPGGQKYSLITYEASPLNRAISATPPDWYAATTTYSTNSVGEVGYYNGSSATSYYPANTLNKTTVTTPQSSTKNIETITWTDTKGRVILSRRKESGSSTNIADTYTLYDDKNRVSKILPPGVNTSIGNADLRFEYLYDGANNMTSKKVPDMALVTMKYNNRDKLVLIQDGNMLALGKWILTKYDDYGRPVSTGLYTGSSPDPNASLIYSEQHANTTYGTSGVELGKVKSTLTWVPGFGTQVNRTFTYSTVTGRMLTDNGTNHLSNATGMDNYTYTYDYAGNVLTKIRAHKTSTSSSILTLTERYTYDRSGRKNAFYHQINTNAEKQIAKYAYDFRDRLIDKSLDSVKVGSVISYLQNIDYAYNEQNWLTSLNSGSNFSALSQAAVALCASAPSIPNPTEAAFAADPDGNDLFKLDLYYDSPGLTFGSPTGQRNGNISQLVWQVRGRERQGYSLQYDYLDRLTTSYYAEITSGGTASTNNKFQENITYTADARGNIATINRSGNYKTTGSATCFTVGTIDNLTFTYNTGTIRLQKVADATSVAAAKSQGFNPGSASSTATYGYDANGNTTSDPYKNLTLTYNHLNLPVSMNLSSIGSISILYDYTGKKLRKTIAPNTGTGYTQDYVDGLEYRTNSGGGTLTLEAVYHAEGRLTPNGASYQYEYNVKDHLGNTRLTFSDLNSNGIVDVPGDILQENHYYPFGMKMNYTWMDNATLDNKYQFNGLEKNEDLNLNLDLAVFRGYDATLGRWLQVDPKPSVSSSSYSFVTNNPFRYADPLGDTLRGVSELSAKRAQALISNTFNKMGLRGSPAASLFKIGKDGKTFQSISMRDFRSATRNLDRKEKALARGYMQAINSTNTVTVDVVKRSEKLSPESISGLESRTLAEKTKTGAQFDDGPNGAGRASEKNVTVILDSRNPGGIAYNDGKSRPADAETTLAHELIGHWLGQRALIYTDGSVEAVQASNLYLQTTGHNYYRLDHGAGTTGQTFDPLGVPSYLEGGSFDSLEDTND